MRTSEKGKFRNFIAIRFGLFMLSFLACLQVGPARADVSELQPFSFGKWVVTDNSTNYFITVATDGSYDNSPELVMMEPPQQGVYLFDGFVDGTLINDVTVSIKEPLETTGKEFLMDDFQVEYPPTVVDGEITVTVGGRARTSGDGNNYGDGIFNGTLTIAIHL